MEAKEYRRLAAIEDSHWWYRAMHRLIIDLCKRLYKGPTLGFPRSDLIRILDAGCGTGGLTKKLEIFGRVAGLDISLKALEPANKKGINLIGGSVNNLPFRGRHFDLVISVSVLYHQRVNDAAAMKEFYRVLKQRGKIILVLPAFSWVYGSHDEAVHTRRRYTLSEAMRLMEFGGFRVIESRYIFSFLFPIFVVKRLAEKIISSREKISDLENMPGFVNSFLFWLCRVEWRMGKYIKLPFGSSLLVVGEKE